MKIEKRIPLGIVSKAVSILELVKQGSIKPRKSKRLGYLSLEVGRRYRLLNKGKQWHLMSHESYNREIDK